MDHRTALRKVFSTLRVLGRQGLAIRGAQNDESSNFMTILKARAEDVKELEDWLQRSGHKWLHHEIQNEILEAMARDVLLKIMEEVNNAEYFSILLDETADIAKTEQVSIYVRIVSPDLLASEYFVGFYSTANTKAEALFEIVKDVLLRFGLPLSKLRGQCYDGAANVAGKISGLQERIREEEPRALFVHCNAHTLNLVVQDGIEKVLPARKFIGEVKDLINFVRDSPRRVAKFQDLQAESEDKVPALAAYCPTRWVVRIKSLKTVLANYTVLMTFFEELSQDPDVQSTVAAKAAGFQQRMESFAFLFLLYTMVQVFDRIEVLNTDLQQSEL
ncbi:hypothetical protein R5R35_004654 [Gryllus longicercus]|uniref:DUF4371 domain-containing protein n=2 Tax=Gryllus longicercus TaxID=2509291 RepID=A0AAN9ZGA4_9ORTH